LLDEAVGALDLVADFGIGHLDIGHNVAASAGSPA
jgi:hypothetical protein